MGYEDSDDITSGDIVKRALWLSPLCFVCLQAAHADAASKARKVGELLSAMHLDATTNRLEQAEEARIDAMSRQQLAGVTLDADQKKSYDEFRHKVVELLRSSATWKALEPDFVKLYSDAYSEDEIDGILAFYRSPVGRTMLAKTPALAEQSISISQRRMAELTPKIQTLVNQFQRDNQ